ncbi:MAG: NAD(P)-binding domain-containing protein, partial [Methanobacterium sp.]|nr:NAD(P)-binding domain-containing protein [Methanobacterium sp.]
MKIGFLGFGEVASTLSKGLLKQGLEVSTSITGRSPKTVLKAKNSGVNLVNSNEELATNCQMLISTVVPKNAVIVAREIGESFRGIYVDLNNIAPTTVRKCRKYLSNSKFVDAAIIGSIRSGINTPLIASGKYASEFAKLNDYGMKIEIIGDKIGQASSIKMLRSSYTKGLAALLFETLLAAYKLNLDEKVLEFISRTECP